MKTPRTAPHSGPRKKEIVVARPEIVSAGELTTLQAQVAVGGEKTNILFRSDRFVEPRASGDPFLAALLLPAMKLGATLRIDAPVSVELLSSTQNIQQIFRKWDADLSIVDVIADQKAATGGRPPAIASFFSGGVDSFYTALKHRQSLDAVVFVHGFDIRLGNTALRQRVSAEMKRAATDLGMDLIEVETNLREFCDPIVSWTNHQFGPAMASVAHALSGTLRTIYFPSSESYAHLDPCASHPLVDPLWGTNALTILHDGAEASRNEKVELIASSEIARTTLRVCWENPANAYNCGRCEKCLRTMINLESVGALKYFNVFDNSLDPRAVERISIPSDLVYFHIEENLRVLRERGGDPALISALGNAVNGYRAERAIGALLAVPRLPRHTPGLGRLAWQHGPALVGALFRAGTANLAAAARALLRRAG